MIWIDFLIIGAISLSALVGLARGLVREAIALIVWGLAILIAWLFHAPVAALLEPWVATPSLRIGLAAILLVFGVLFLGAILAFVLTKLIEHAGLSGTDRLLGMAFGAARGAVVVALAVMIASLTPLAQDPWWHESSLLPHFQQLADQILAWLPDDLVEKAKSF